MVLNSGKEIGLVIANQQKEINQIKQDISPNDPSASFPLFSTETAKVTKVLKGIKKIIKTDSFVIDHVTLGDIDSATLKIDGGYTVSTVTFPLTFPITFTGGEEVLFTKIL